MKFIIIKCNITCANKKSAKPRSGPIPLKQFTFTGFTCKRRQTETCRRYLSYNIL
jgi:hypothetical protein